MYVELGRYEDAMNAFKKAIEMRPGFAVSYIGLGRCYHKMRRIDEAEQMLKKGIELDPGSASSYLDLGQLYSEISSFDKEIAVYQRLLERDSSSAMAHSYLATAIVAKYQVEIGYRSMGKEPAKDNVIIDKAMALFDRSIGTKTYPLIRDIRPVLFTDVFFTELDPACGMCHGQRADLLKDAHRC
jgi:tetratricopeptide (TPR) repeat protein